MSLATRCTHCDTVFRVVQDQLKVSEGWVRCGRCQEVFNALDGLFDLEPKPEPAQAEGPVLVPEVVPAADESPPLELLPDAAPDVPPAEPPQVETPADDLPSEVPPSQSLPVPFDATPASRVAERDRVDFADAPFNSALPADDGPESALDPADPSVPERADAPANAPEFLRQAEREARWERPRTVALMWLLCVLLGLGLALQAAVHFRDLLAAVAPKTRPALALLCEWAACNVEPLRRIDAIAIESSTLTSLPDGDTVRLAVVLRNRGPLPLAMPSIELGLTDAGGQMLARRVLSPSDFDVREATLPAASEATLQLAFSTQGRRASGYTVEPFYP